MTGNNNYSHSLPSFSKKSLALLSYQLHPTPHHMLRPLPFLLLTALCCSFFSCKKDPPITIIKGIVIDSKTSMPLSDALIEIRNCISNNTGLCDRVYDSTKSDQNGVFSYTVPSEAQTSNLSAVLVDNYAYKKIVGAQFKSYPGKINDFTIPLIKLDGILKINIRNESGQYDHVNVAIYNPTSISEADSLSGRITLLPDNLFTGEEKNYVFPLVANEYTKINWGFDNFIYNQTIPSHRDSVFLLPNDTLSYSIIF